MRESVEHKDLIKLEGVINESIKNGKKRERRVRGYRISSLALMMIMIFGINISPTFAKAIGDIPIIGEHLMRLSIDDGIEKAKEKGYAQEVKKVQEIQGFRVTVETAIADDKRIYIEAILEDLNGALDDPKIKKRVVDLKVMEIKENGNRTLVSNLKTDDMKTTFKKIGDRRYKISKDIVLTKGNKITEEILILLDAVKCSYGGSYQFKNLMNSLDSNYRINEAIRIELDPKFLKEYNRDSKVEVITIGGIKYSVDEINISPLSTRVILNEVGNSDLMIKDKNKTMDYDYYSLEDELGDIWLQDENGNKYDLLWSCIRTRNKGSKEGILKQGYLELKFESAYYDEASELSLKGMVYVVNKEKQNLELDLVNKEIKYNEESIDSYEIKEILNTENSGERVVVIVDKGENFSQLDSYINYKDFGYGTDEDGYKYYINPMKLSMGSKMIIEGAIVDGVDGYLMYIRKTGTNEGKKGELEKVVIPVSGLKGELIEDINIKILE